SVVAAGEQDLAVVQHQHGRRGVQGGGGGVEGPRLGGRVEDQTDAGPTAGDQSPAVGQKDGRRALRADWRRRGRRPLVGGRIEQERIVVGAGVGAAADGQYPAVV